MKTILKTLIATFVLSLVLGAASASAQGRTATVDLKKLFDGYWKTKQADAALKDRAAGLDKEHKAMIADFNKGRDDYKALLASASDPAASESERDRKKKDAEEKLRNLKDQEEAIMKFQKQATTTLDEQRRRMRDNLLGEVRKAVEGRAKAASYALVIDVAAETINNTPVILFTNGENDITGVILDQINSSAPPEALKPVDDKKEPAAPAPEKKEPAK
jgi:Skp family chaperone for outer membrane proteins